MSFSNRFMCVCSDEELQDCQAVMAEVQAMFNHASVDPRYADAGLASDAVYWAESKSGRRYEWSFVADQWAGVTCAEYMYDGSIGKYGQFEQEPSDTVFFQCDVVEHGIAACIKYFEDKWRENSVEGGTDGLGEVVGSN